MATLDWNKWADAWSASFPKNQMWGSIRSGEHDPETGEPLYRFNDKPTTESMDPHLADIVAEHRFVAPAVLPEGQPADWENCFCGWNGEHHGDHLQEQLRGHVGDHVADPENTVEKADAEDTGDGRRPGGSGFEKDDKAHKADEAPKPAAQKRTVKAKDSEEE